ncbi:hypothetical protein LTR95_007130 [Oleoguttula sp. CCFEE 5521]
MTTPISETPNGTIATSSLLPSYPGVVTYTSKVIGGGVESVDHTVASDPAFSELHARPLNRTPIEKRVWLKKDPVTNRCRWRRANLYMLSANDLPSINLESWNTRVQHRMKQDDPANSLSASINLSRFRVKVTTASIGAQPASAAKATSTVVGSLDDKDHKTLSQALLIMKVAQRRSAALVGNTIFDADATGTVTDKGLMLCFGTRQHAETHEGFARKPSPTLVPKLFFASGSVADFMLSRFPDAQQIKIDEGSQVSEDINVTLQRYLRKAVTFRE